MIRFLKKLNRIYRNFRRRKRIKYYIKHGHKPWSKGYPDFKWQLIEKNINNINLLKKFRNNSELPRFYGKNIDERIIEYPWVMSNLPREQGILLDAGSALNFVEILNHKKLNNKQIIIVNLGPESNCFWEKKISYLFTDLRQLPFLDNHFDIIICISTLEHIGMDNTMIYTNNQKYQEDKSKDYLKVVLELKRVLKSNGTLLLTVPFGRYQNFQFFQQFNQEMVDKILKVFCGKRQFISYYKYSKNGWNISKSEDCKNVEYFDIWQTKYKDKNSNKGYDPDFAAAARAVACLRLIK